MEEAPLRSVPLPRRRIAASLIVVLGGCASASACGRHADATTALGRIQENRKIVIATDALYPPNEFKRDGEIVGFDVDLGSALADRLGVRAEFQDVKFDAILQALKEGKYDISLSSFTDTRRREADFDFVTYLSAGTSLMVPKGNPHRLHPNDLSLCGRRVAVERGTTQEDELTPPDADRPGAGARVTACKRAHRRAPVPVAYDDQNAANRALRKGRAEAVLADSPSVAYGVRESGGAFEASGQPYGTAPYGVVIPKHQEGLRDAILKAIKHLISDGTYRKLIQKWGLAAAAITDPRINAAN